MTSRPASLARFVAPVAVLLLIGAGAAAATGVEGDETPSGTAPPTTAAPSEAPTSEAPTTEPPSTPPTTELAPPTESTQAPPSNEQLPEAEEQDEPGTDNGQKSAAAPVDCASARNHGQYVSWVARNTPPGPGRDEIIRAAAHSSCGKGAKPAKAHKGQGTSGDNPGKHLGHDKAAKNKSAEPDDED